MKQVQVQVPAKINLSFDIVGRRRSGYHTIRSVMQAIGLFDTIEAEQKKSKGISISCDTLHVPLDQTNIVFKAAEAFLHYFKIDYGVKIHIFKNIPMQAGLGGGSADGAGTLLALNHLFRIDATTHLLCEIGQTIGADIPFCLTGATALAEGIGEQLTKLPDLPECFLVVAKPAMGISTANSYQRYDNLTQVDHPNIQPLLVGLQERDIEKIAANMGNVLEQVADIPDIFLIKKQMLLDGALGAIMTGSGSAVVAVFKDRAAAKRSLKHLYSLAYSCFLVEPVSFGADILNL